MIQMMRFLAERLQLQFLYLFTLSGTDIIDTNDAIFGGDIVALIPSFIVVGNRCKYESDVYLFG